MGLSLLYPAESSYWGSPIYVDLWKFFKISDVSPAMSPASSFGLKPDGFLPDFILVEQSIPVEPAKEQQARDLFNQEWEAFEEECRGRFRSELPPY